LLDVERTHDSKIILHRRKTSTQSDFD
jgi:hypothetical protein